MRAVGLDPGIGIVHADQRARDSLALDLLEVVRPDIDRYLLTLLQEHTFTASDFFETRRGSVRIRNHAALCKLACACNDLVKGHFDEVLRGVYPQ